MEAYEGIKVGIISGGKPLLLYSDPDAAEHESIKGKQYYVEALTGQTFIVSVTVSSKFKAMGAEGIRIEMITDDNTDAWGSFIAKEQWSGGRTYTHKLSFIYQYCEKTRQWRKYEYSFGELNIQDNVGHGISPASIRNLGEIRINVYRANKVMRRIPRLCAKGGTVKEVKEVSEKTLKGKAIASSIRLKEGSVMDVPNPIHYDVVALPGSDGQRKVVTILYRSKQNLQSLGCIPRTPTPEPVEIGNVKLNKIDSSTAIEREQRIQALRAQLALLEAEPKVKAEISSEIETVKREREEDATDSTSKRTRKPGQIETVDLTGD